MLIPRAREPVLVFKSTLRNISIDISVDNHRGLVKSKILFLLSNIDGRFRDLVLIVGPFTLPIFFTRANPFD